MRHERTKPQKLNHTEKMKTEESAAFEHVKTEIQKAIQAMRETGAPELADHLTKHIIFDEKKGTACYTGKE